MKQTIETGVDPATAKKVLEKAMEQYLERFKEYSPRFGWTGERDASFGFKAKGMSLGGTVKILETKMEVDMDVPFLLKPFQGRAMGILEEQVHKWVELAKKGEL